MRIGVRPVFKRCRNPATMRHSRPLFIGLLVCSAVVARADWPDFRGPWANGHASAPGDTNRIGLPMHWSETENVKWKTPIPFRGWSTPVILGNQIWLTTATEDGHDFFAICADVGTGKIIFNERLFHCEKPEPLGNALNGYASPSAVIEPGRVYVHFGSYGTACLDTRDFKVLWRRDDVPCLHFRGPGSSPVLFKDLLILTMDGIDMQYLIALDRRTGKTVWKTDRTANWNDLDSNGKPRGGGDFRKGFSTPFIIDVGGAAQMFSVSSKAAYSNDPLTGRELWKIGHGDHSPAARPVFDRGMVYMACGGGNCGMLALRVDGQGDLADTNYVWRATRAAPKMPSPLLVHGMLFMVNDGGVATCLDAANGKEYWQERVGSEFSASLLYGDGRVYSFDRDGKTTVFRPARTFEVLATNRLADGFMASPAVSGKALILRTRTHLYRIEEGAKLTTLAD